MEFTEFIISRIPTDDLAQKYNKLILKNVQIKLLKPNSNFVTTVTWY